MMSQGASANAFAPTRVDVVLVLNTQPCSSSSRVLLCPYLPHDLHCTSYRAAVQCSIKLQLATYVIAHYII